MTINMQKALSAWQQPDFEKVLKAEIELLDGKQLPLQAGLSYSSYALDDDVSATILNSNEDQSNIQIKAGLFYKGIIAGCSCSDDPGPTDEQLEYCEIMLLIDKQSAEVKIDLISD